MATNKSILAQNIRSRILQSSTAPEIGYYIKEERNFYDKYRTVVVYIQGNDNGRWTFVDNSFRSIPGFNKGLSLSVTQLGDTILIKYDRTAVTLSPDFLDIQYRIEQRSSGRQSSGRFKAWGVIRTVSTTTFTS